METKKWNKKRVWNEIENNLETKKALLPTWVYYMAASIVVILLLNVFYINKLNNVKNNYTTENKIDTIVICDTIFKNNIVENIVYKTDEKIIYKEKTIHDTVVDYKYIVEIDTVFIDNNNSIAENKIDTNNNKIAFSKYDFSNQKTDNDEKISIKFKIGRRQSPKNTEYFVKNKTSFLKYQIPLN